MQSQILQCLASLDATTRNAPGQLTFLAAQPKKHKVKVLFAAQGNYLEMTTSPLPSHPLAAPRAVVEGLRDGQSQKRGAGSRLLVLTPADVGAALHWDGGR